MIAQGATGEELAKTYLSELRQQFGKAVKVPEEFQWEWLTIPHIFASPFYCYAYSFGNLLVLALYRMYQKEGAAFVPKYLDLLRTGGSMSPQTHSRRQWTSIWPLKSFWQSGFDDDQRDGRPARSHAVSLAGNKGATGSSHQSLRPVDTSSQIVAY